MKRPFEDKYADLITITMDTMIEKLFKLCFTMIVLMENRKVLQL